ncbi:hypothetical protein SLA2020_190010 [Shorea laevis]
MANQFSPPDSYSSSSWLYGDGGSNGISSTTIVWIVVGVLIGLFVLVCVYIVAKKCDLGLDCMCKAGVVPKSQMKECESKD